MTDHSGPQELIARLRFAAMDTLNRDRNRAEAREAADWIKAALAREAALQAEKDQHKEDLSKPHDGGPAFPMNDIGIHGFYGMSLRDWFAGQALSIVHRRFLPDAYPDPQDIALQAYFIAEAMLEARDEVGL